MSVPRSVVPLLAIIVWACGDDTASPQPTSVLEGRYVLTWSTDSAAPSVTIVPGVAVTIDQCGDGTQQPNASFVFSDSTALTLQATPQAYALTVVGMITDCSGTRTRYFDVAAGEYLVVDDTWITLMGDLDHPNFDARVVDTTADSVAIVLRPGLPGLAFPLAGVDQLYFTRP
jgi:hypothetical protein